jgi:anti-sigma regulatory factor (Ser/Thr protein kinase)
MTFATASQVAGAVPWCLTLTLTTEAGSMRLARKLVKDAVLLAGGSAADACDVEVAVGEVFANAHRHAYARGVGPLSVELSYAPPDLHVLIHDDGAPIVDRPTIPTTLPAGSGWGLYLIGQLMDEAIVIHPHKGDRGTAVRMVKRLRG